MSRITQSASTKSTEAEETVWPEFNPSTGYRAFIERLRLARLERGFSIADMSDEVGLTFRLAHEFETLAAPLPFEWLEVWCQVVGVPFEDFLAIYWADQREWQERQDQKQSNPQAPCITITTPVETEAPETPELSRPTRARGCNWLSILHAAFARIASFFRSPSSTPKK